MSLSKTVKIASAFVLLCGSVFSCANAAELTANPRSAYREEANVVKQIDEFSGFTCVPYRYESRRDVDQTLGFIDKNKPMIISAPEKRRRVFDRVERPRRTQQVKKVIRQEERKPAYDFVQIQEKAVPASVESVKANKVDKVKEAKISQVNNASNSTTKEAPALNNTKNVKAESEKSKPVLNASATKALSAPERFEIRFHEYDAPLSEENKVVISKVAEKAMKDQNLQVKINSYVPNVSGKVSEVKRSSLKRAIKARKQLIESGVSPIRISVSSMNNSNSSASKLEFLLENAS